MAARWTRRAAVMAGTAMMLLCGAGADPANACSLGVQQLEVSRTEVSAGERIHVRSQGPIFEIVPEGEVPPTTTTTHADGWSIPQCPPIREVAGVELRFSQPGHPEVIL